VRDVPLNVNFTLSEPLLEAAALSQNLTNTLIASQQSQLLQWNMKLLTMLTELTEVFGSITRLRMNTDKNGIAG